MILVCICCMPAVLNLLIILFQLHFGIKQTVLIDVLFVLDFLVVCQPGSSCLVLLCKLCNLLLVSFFCSSLFQLTALLYRLVIFAVKMCLNVSFCICYQLCCCILISCFHRFCFFQLCPVRCQLCFFFLACKGTVAF